MRLGEGMFELMRGVRKAQYRVSKPSLLGGAALAIVLAQAPGAAAQTVNELPMRAPGSAAPVLQYDTVGQLGFVGSSTTPAGFPRLNGLSASFGPSNANSYFDGTLTSVASGTWVHGNHT